MGNTNKEEQELDWNRLWNNKMDNVTYAGVIVLKCANCGDIDVNAPNLDG